MIRIYSLENGHFFQAEVYPDDRSTEYLFRLRYALDTHYFTAEVSPFIDGVPANYFYEIQRFLALVNSQNHQILKDWNNKEWNAREMFEIFKRDSHVY